MNEKCQFKDREDIMVRVNYIEKISDAKKRYTKAWCKFSDALSYFNIIGLR